MIHQMSCKRHIVIHGLINDDNKFTNIYKMIHIYVCPNIILNNIKTTSITFTEYWRRFTGLNPTELLRAKDKKGGYRCWAVSYYTERLIVDQMSRKRHIVIHGLINDDNKFTNIYK
jgi:hypothetical protein